MKKIIISIKSQYLNKCKFQVYKQKIPIIAANEQPTIAIITFHYAEKLAVDAMLDNKETFVRYTNMGKN